MMHLSPAGATEVRIHEGFVDHWYPDPVGIGTIGTGFTWRSTAFRRWWGMVKNGQKFGPGATITRTQNDEALIMVGDEEYGRAVNEFLGKDVPQHVFDAMFSVAFNCGPGSLEWRWAEAAKRGDYAEAARLLKTTATTATNPKTKQKVTLQGLVNRRKDEARLLAEGIYAHSAGVHMPEVKDNDKADDDGILIKGERGESVKRMQSALQGIGLYNGVLDGIFGNGTETAVVAFQRANKLEADGWAGPKTLKALGV